MYVGVSSPRRFNVMSPERMEAKHIGLINRKFLVKLGMTGCQASRHSRESGNPGILVDWLTGYWYIGKFNTSPNIPVTNTQKPWIIPYSAFSIPNRGA